MAAGIGRSILIVVLFVLAVWAVAALAGIEISLVGTLVASVGLTLLLNLLMAGFRRVRRT